MMKTKSGISIQLGMGLLMQIPMLIEEGHISPGWILAAGGVISVSILVDVFVPNLFKEKKSQKRKKSKIKLKAA